MNEQTENTVKRDAFLSVMVWVYLVIYGLAFLAIAVAMLVPSIRNGLIQAKVAGLVLLTNPLSLLLLLIVLAALLLSLRGLWLMRRWGAYLFGFYLISNLAVNVSQGNFRPSNYILDALMVVAISLAIKRMA